MSRSPGDVDGFSSADSERGFFFTAAVLFTGLLVTLAAQLHGLAPDWLRSQRSAYGAGWSFFAEAASEDVLVVYRPGTDGRTFPVVTRQLMSAENGWGLSRVSYVQILEARQIADQIASERWTACHDSAADACLRHALIDPVNEATNMSRRPTICGQVILAIEHPQSWNVDRQTGRTARSITKAARCQRRPKIGSGPLFVIGTDRSGE